MRTLRELGGWAILLALWVVPTLPFLALTLWVEAHFSGVWIVLALLAVACWPGLRLAGRRLRTPPFEELAEADGRRPVLVLHRFAHAALPWPERAAIWQEGLRRDWRDSGWLRAIRKGFEPAGPVLPMARPVPPDRGPVLLTQRDPGWEAELDRRLKTSRLAVIVLDASDACRYEIARAFELLGPRRTVLLMPARPERALAEAWPTLQGLVPGLPDFDSHAIGYRFERDGRPLVLQTRFGASVRRKLLASPTVMLFDHEPTPGPRPPSIARLLMALPACAGLAGAVVVPLLLDESGVRIPEDAAIAFGLGSFALGITLSVMSRRAFRLVASNELPFVTVAALPWLFGAGLPWLDGDWASDPYSLGAWLRLTVFGAAYAAPLLLATAVVLSGGALVRRAPNRTPVHAVFGLATLVPFATLLATIPESSATLTAAWLFFAAGAGACVLAVVGASGDGGRPHAPLPIGAAAAAALAIAAWATVFTCDLWRELVLAGTRGVDGMGRFLTLVPAAPELARYAEAWAWFLLAVPAAVVLVAGLHHGRASRVAVGNLAALAPMLVLFGLVSTAQAGALSAVGRAYQRSDARILHRAIGRAGATHRIELASLGSYGERSSAPVDVVVSGSDAWVGGEHVPGITASPTLEGYVVDAVRRRASRSGPLRLAASRGTPYRGIGKIARAARSLGASGITFVGSGDEGYRGVTLPFTENLRRAAARDESLLFVQIRNGDYVLASTDGTNIVASGYDDHRLAEVLVERRRLEPNRRTLIVAPEDGAPAEVVLRAIQVAQESGFPDLSLLADSSWL